MPPHTGSCPPSPGTPRSSARALYVLRAANKSDAAHTITPGIYRPMRRFDDLRMRRKPEIIVGAKIQYGFAANHDFGALRTGNDPFGLEQTRSIDFSKFPGDSFYKG